MGLNGLVPSVDLLEYCETFHGSIWGATSQVDGCMPDDGYLVHFLFLLMSQQFFFTLPWSYYCTDMSFHRSKNKQATDQSKIIKL